MSKVATSAPGPEKDEPISIGRLADTQKSDAHVAQLLHIGEYCSKYLCCRLEVGETFEINPTLTKECVETLALVHVRLRDLIDEQRRWSLDPSVHEREASKLVDSTLELYSEKTKNAKLYNRPAIFLRPRIGRFERGWITWVGGDSPMHRDLHGIGDTPELAMKAFDTAFYDQQKLADAQPAVVIPPPAPKRAPRKSKKK